MNTVIVIGGGASGILAALTAAENPNNRVLLLERQQRIGRKLLATGNGRCNLTNTGAAPENYHGEDPDFVRPTLSAFGPEDALRYFHRLGLLTAEEYGGRVYPLSNSANSVLDVLRLALDRAGVEQRCAAPVKSLRREKRGFALAKSRGELQFTDNGVSGPAVFDLSRAAATGGEGLTLHIRLLPLEEAEILSLLRERQAGYPELPASEILTGMLHNRLGRMLGKYAGLSANTPLRELTEAELGALARACVDFPLPVKGTEGFDHAQVTAGGLRTADFDPRTLESRLVPGLFACGELLDVDGDCGGYNLQWAWASGRLAGRLGT